MEQHEFLDRITNPSRPRPNVQGNFDCMTCYKPVDNAHYDPARQELRWWCPEDHESIMKEIQL
jgi:hypothetical protein